MGEIREFPAKVADEETTKCWACGHCGGQLFVVHVRGMLQCVDCDTFMSNLRAKDVEPQETRN